jgi:hypothetical protein
MPTDKQQYVKTMNQLADRYGKLEDQTIRDIQSMLKDLRKDIAAQMLSTTDFEAFRLRGLKTAINRLIDEFNRRASQSVNSSIKGTHELGEQSVNEPLEKLGIKIERAGFIKLDAAQANIALDYSTDLIQAISDPMRSQINKLLRLAILGTKKPIDVMREITQVLGVEARTGVWKKKKDPVKGVALRAETDLRTELQRAYNLSHRSQQIAVQEIVPELMKIWVANGDHRTRKSHLIAHRHYKKHPIPVSEPFILSPTKGKNKGRKFKMMYPLDPDGPPELVINCR